MTVTPNPGLVNPESFMGTSRSAGALIGASPQCLSKQDEE